ncbi:Uncharacterized protein PBTT_00680 [Plasmodiophora brassicae]
MPCSMWGPDHSERTKRRGVAHSEPGFHALGKAPNHDQTLQVGYYMTVRPFPGQDVCDLEVTAPAGADHGRIARLSRRCQQLVTHTLDDT